MNACGLLSRSNSKPEIRIKSVEAPARIDRHSLMCCESIRECDKLDPESDMGTITF